MTLVVDSGVAQMTPGALSQLAGWMEREGSIAFAAGLILTSEDTVLESGCAADEAGVDHPLFRGERLRAWNALGGVMWHRNVEAASPYLLALRTADIRRMLPAVARGAWRQSFHRLCRALADERQGGRGVIDPSARAILGFVPPLQPQGLIGHARPYLHPYLTIGTQGVIAFAKSPSNEAAARQLA